MLALVLALGLAVGLLAGGSISALSQARFRGAGALLVLLGVQLALPLLRPSGILARVLFFVWLASFVLMAVVAFLNRAEPGMLLIAAGLLLNGVVIAANGGMPVSVEAALAAGGSVAGAVPLPGDFAHVVMGGATRLTWLADVMSSPGPRGLAVLMSPGDVVLFSGVVAYVAGSMTRRGVCTARRTT